MTESTGASFFDRCEGFTRKVPRSADNLPRLRRQYQAIISRNCDLFGGARVLDIMSSYGFWSFAALDAGATHVLGLESSRAAVEATKKVFAEYPIDSSSYQFVASEIPAALRTLEPETLDIVLCHGFLERADPRFVFQQIARLRVKNVILDTRIARGQGPMARFSRRPGNAPGGKYQNIVLSPSHELIAFLCDYFQFRWHLIDWHEMGITDWTGIADYMNDHHRTYLLEASSGG
jgi:hypothetical protein